MCVDGSSAIENQFVGDPLHLTGDPNFHATYLGALLFFVFGEIIRFLRLLFTSTGGAIIRRCGNRQTAILPFLCN